MTLLDLESILAGLDSAYTKHTCGSGSVYYRCGSLRIRVSNHFKKTLDKPSAADMSLIQVYGYSGFLVLLDKSIHPIAIEDYDDLAHFLEYEKFRRDKFFPRPSAEVEADVDEDSEDVVPDAAEAVIATEDDLDAPWNCEWPLGECSRSRLDTAYLTARERYKNIANIGAYIKKVMQTPMGPTDAGTLISVAYHEAGLKYTTNKYKEYKTFNGSYKELVYSLGRSDEYAEYIDKNV